MSEGESGTKHKKPLIALIVANTVSLVITVLINAISNEDVFPEIFKSNIGDVSDKYYLMITPAGWTFSIWGFIYTAQFIYCAYTLSLICRRGPDNKYLYQSPPYMVPHVVYICFIGANVANLVWVVIWTLELINAASVLIAVGALFLLLASGFSMYGLYVSIPELEELKLKREIWLNRIFVQNSLAFYATWVSIATLINLGVVLVYTLGMKNEDASSISLGILALDILVYFILDLFLAYRYCNYVVIPYVVIIVALSGSLDKNFVPWNRTSIMTVILLIVGVGLFIVKIVIMVWRHFKSDKVHGSEKLVAEDEKA